MKKIESTNLRPVKNSIFRNDSLISRKKQAVSDNGYISSLACQYLLPAKYKNKDAETYTTDTKLFAFDIYSGN